MIELGRTTHPALLFAADRSSMDDRSRRSFLRCMRSEDGASLVEYALLVALIAVVCIAAVTILGKNSSNKFNEVGSSIG